MNLSLVDYLKTQGKDASLSSRAQMALDYGLVGSTGEYTTLASQGKNANINTSLLAKLNAGEKGTPTASAPTSTSIASGAANMNANAMTGSTIEKSASLPEPTSFLETTKRKSLSDMVGEVAASTMDSNKLEIDNLRAELQRITETEKTAAEAKVKGLEGKVQQFVGSTDAQDALKANNDKFKVEENIKLYTDIQTKIVSAQEALDMGLIYEKDRPARMKFVTGSESTLMKQGLATIGALQGTAAVIKGNLDLARSFGEATINAINQDNEMSFKALTTLLDLANSELVDLSDRERTLIDNRLTAIESEADRLQKNKDDVLDLMMKYPKAFQAGGVTLLDSKEGALQKMMPTMASDEKRLFEAEITSKQTKGADAAKVAEVKAEMLQLKANGMTYKEAVVAYADTLSVEYIASVYGVKPAGTSGEDTITDQYYKQYLDESGNMKPGYTVAIDPKNGRPVVTETPKKSEGSWWQFWK